MERKRTVLITGATGKQGGALCRALRGADLELRALTRTPESAAAKALAASGVKVVAGDLDDPDSLKDALEGCWGAYSVQNTWEAGVEREEEQGKRFATLAREAGVRCFVYSSVGSAERRTGIPHFDNKFRVEQWIRQLGFPVFTILRPVFFMENLTSPWFLQEGKLVSALSPSTRLQMVAVSDIGRVGARAFTDVQTMNGRAIEIAGDSASLPQAARLLSEARGVNIPYAPIDIEVVRSMSADMATMLEWFERVGYGANIAALDEEFGPMTRLARWFAGQAITQPPRR